MDKLEKYITEQREAFDRQQPPEAVWLRLEKQLAAEQEAGRSPKRKIMPLFPRAKKWLSVAAVLLLCVSFAAFIRTYQVKSTIAQQAIPTDLQEAQAYYKTQIKNHIARINQLRPDNPDGDSALWHMLGEEDAEYHRLRNALKDNPDNPHVRAAFVEYYRSRLEVLKRMEDRMKDKKNP